MQTQGMNAVKAVYARRTMNDKKYDTLKGSYLFIETWLLYFILTLVHILDYSHQILVHPLYAIHSI